MADVAQDPGDVDAADREADAVAGADHADQGWRKAFVGAAQCDIGALEAIAADEDAGGDEEGNQGAYLAHGGRGLEGEGNADSET